MLDNVYRLVSLISIYPVLSADMNQFL